MTEVGFGACILGFYFGLLWECVGGVWSCPSRLTFGDYCLFHLAVDTIGDHGCCHFGLLVFLLVIAFCCVV